MSYVVGAVRYLITAFPEGLGKAGIGGAIGGQDELFGG